MLPKSYERSTPTASGNHSRANLLFARSVWDKLLRVARTASQANTIVRAIEEAHENVEDLVALGLNTKDDLRELESCITDVYSRVPGESLHRVSEAHNAFKRAFRDLFYKPNLSLRDGHRSPARNTAATRRSSAYLDPPNYGRTGNRPEFNQPTNSGIGDDNRISLDKPITAADIHRAKDYRFSTRNPRSSEPGQYPGASRGGLRVSMTTATTTQFRRSSYLGDSSLFRRPESGISPPSNIGGQLPGTSRSGLRVSMTTTTTTRFRRSSYVGDSSLSGRMNIGTSLPTQGMSVPSFRGGLASRRPSLSSAPPGSAYIKDNNSQGKLTGYNASTQRTKIQSRIDELENHAPQRMYGAERENARRARGLAQERPSLSPSFTAPTSTLNSLNFRERHDPQLSQQFMGRSREKFAVDTAGNLSTSSTGLANGFTSVRARTTQDASKPRTNSPKNYEHYGNNGNSLARNWDRVSVTSTIATDSTSSSYASEGKTPISTANDQKNYTESLMSSIPEIDGLRTPESDVTEVEPSKQSMHPFGSTNKGPASPLWHIKTTNEKDTRISKQSSASVTASLSTSKKSAHPAPQELKVPTVRDMDERPNEIDSPRKSGDFGERPSLTSISGDVTTTPIRRTSFAPHSPFETRHSDTPQDQPAGVNGYPGPEESGRPSINSWSSQRNSDVARPTMSGPESHVTFRVSSETGQGRTRQGQARRPIRRLAEWDRLRMTGRSPINPNAGFASTDEESIGKRDRGRVELYALCACALREEALAGMRSAFQLQNGKEKIIVRIIGEYVLGMNSFQLRWILGRPLGSGGQSQVYEIRHRYRCRFLEPMSQQIKEAEEARQRMLEAPSAPERKSARKVVERLRGQVEQTMSTLPALNFAVKMAAGVSSPSVNQERPSDADMLAQEARMMKLVTEAAADLTPGQPLPVPPLLEYCESKTLDASFLVMPIYPGGDLLDRILAIQKASKQKRSVELVTSGEGGISEADAIPVIRALTVEIARLHSFGVIHRDIKPENIVFERMGKRKGPMLKSKWPRVADGHDRLVLLDLGLAIPAGPGADGRTESSACGTVLYGAPEQVAGKPHGYTVDIWSLGVVAYVILCGCNPFNSGSSEAEQRALAARSEYEFPEDGPSPAAREFIRRCLLVDPRGRPTAVDLLESNSWLRKGLMSTEELLGTPGLGRNHVVAQQQVQAELSVSCEDTISEVSHTPRKSNSKDHFFGSPLSARAKYMTLPAPIPALQAISRLSQTEASPSHGSNETSNTTALDVRAEGPSVSCCTPKSDGNGSELDDLEIPRSERGKTWSAPTGKIGGRNEDSPFVASAKNGRQRFAWVKGKS